MGALYCAICEVFEMYLLHTLRAFADMQIADIVSPTAAATQASHTPCTPPLERDISTTPARSRSIGAGKQLQWIEACSITSCYMLLHHVGQIVDRLRR